MEEPVIPDGRADEPPPTLLVSQSIVNIAPAYTGGPVRKTKGDDGVPLFVLMKVIYGDDMGMGPGYSTCFAYFYRMALELGKLEDTAALTSPESSVIIKKFDDSLAERLQAIMTPAQTRSFLILWKWWRACSEECIAIDEAELFEFFGDPVEDHEQENDEQEFYSYNTVRTKIHRAGGTPYELAFDSVYNTCMASLFNAEFGNFLIGRNGGMLARQREGAAQDAACLHVALESLYAGPSARDPILQYQDNHLVHREPHPPLQPTRGTRRRILGEDDFAGLDPRCVTGSSIESCPWLGDIIGFPLYLWDREKRETIDTFEILEQYNFSIPYTAITHTWGRWRKHDEPSVNMKPKVAWLIPQNGLFEVADLPDILERVPTDTRYIWFDLVCIPQICKEEVLTDQLKRNLKTEIASQAAIFKGAKHAIAWWNTETAPETWDGIQSAIQWMSSIYMDLEFTNERPLNVVTGEGLDALPTGMFSETEKDTMPWFSSLWTLQEVCLRPDVWLCNKHWGLLTVGDGTLVAFNTLVALTMKTVHTLVDEAGERTTPLRLFPTIWKGRYHRGFLELLELLNRTGMDEMHQLKRENILFLATSRYCRHSRAQAIMAVVGMTKWYNPSVEEEEPRHSNKPGFVFDQYPLSFVQEVAENLGANFFTSVLTHPADQPLDEMRGTMLPFRAYMTEPKTPHTSVLEAMDHPSVQTWMVQGDGRVSLSQVEIFFSSDFNERDFPYMTCFFHLSRKIESNIVARERLQPEGDRYHGDLRHWMKNVIPEIYGEGKYYAIHLRYARGGWDGLLLKSVDETSGLMVKIGNLHMLTARQDGDYLPGYSGHAVEMVNWTVM